MAKSTIDIKCKMIYNGPKSSREPLVIIYFMEGKEMKVLNKNPDRTQKYLIEELKTTEELLSKVATKLSGTKKKAEIYAMPDLSIPPYAYRLCGGFPTGIFAHWETDVPFIPVDTTMNVCGVSIYRLNNIIDPLEFKKRVLEAFGNRSYNWNYTKGNHLVSLMYNDGTDCLQRGEYLVLHASANEYQQNNMQEGLFVMTGNWFYDQIATETIENGRYLRYISGQSAERFFRIYKKLEKYNMERNDFFARLVLGDYYDKRVVSSIHYGMPTINSISIGCHWHCRLYPLLTAPGKDIYLVYPDWKKSFKIGGKKVCLSPHGFGVKTDIFPFKIDGEKVVIGEKVFYANDYEHYSITIGKDTKVRGEDQVNETVTNILSSCTGEIVDRLEQIAAFTSKGFEIYI